MVGAETELELVPSEAARGAASVVGCIAVVMAVILKSYEEIYKLI